MSWLNFAACASREFEGLPWLASRPTSKMVQAMALVCQRHCPSIAGCRRDVESAVDAGQWVAGCRAGESLDQRTRRLRAEGRYVAPGTVRAAVRVEPLACAG
jgi:hypothetical protein